MCNSRIVLWLQLSVKIKKKCLGVIFHGLLRMIREENTADI